MRKQLRPITLISFFLCLSLCFPVWAKAKKTFVVNEVANLTEQPGWENHLIALGIRNIVNDELYARGNYIPLEEKPEIMDQIDKLIASRWTNSSTFPKPATELFSCDLTISVRVTDFSRRRTRSIGLFAAAKTTVSVTVEIEIRDKEQPPIILSGTGEGITKSLGILFQIRSDKVHFNETTVGQATQKAVKNALSKL
ncbi:MAG: hypothetical protein JXR59_04510 [Desulfuromonadaceae bacterium]|nr:hypothetical protein [Desulfuromonadaceae bacterium]